MQDDQTKSVDGLVKSEGDSSGGSGDLTLSGKPSMSANTPADGQKQSDSSIPDPAQEALEQSQKQSEQSTGGKSSKTKENTTDLPPVESEPPVTPSDSQSEASSDTAVAGSPPETSTDTGSGAALPVDSTLDPIKKEALKKLEPLVNELDLHPEEKYRALMMIIQATDNKDLVNEAYQAADKIEDTKTRAQALLSIVNEIEYFKNKEIASSNQ